MDWTSIISELRLVGYSQAQIAKACGCKQNSVSDLFTQRIRHPTYAVGDAMIRLHKRHKKAIDVLKKASAQGISA